MITSTFSFQFLNLCHFGLTLLRVRATCPRRIGPAAAAGRPSEPVPGLASCPKTERKNNMEISKKLKIHIGSLEMSDFEMFVCFCLTFGTQTMFGFEMYLTEFGTEDSNAWSP